MIFLAYPLGLPYYLPMKKLKNPEFRVKLFVSQRQIANSANFNPLIHAALSTKVFQYFGINNGRVNGKFVNGPTFNLPIPLKAREELEACKSTISRQFAEPFSLTIKAQYA